MGQATSVWFSIRHRDMAEACNSILSWAATGRAACACPACGWLERNDMGDVCSIDRCEGGVLAWFVLDEQAKSRTEGLSIPNSLRNYLVSAHDNFGLKGLGVHVRPSL